MDDLNAVYGLTYSVYQSPSASGLSKDIQCHERHLILSTYNATNLQTQYKLRLDLNCSEWSKLHSGEVPGGLVDSRSNFTLKLGFFFSNTAFLWFIPRY